MKIKSEFILRKLAGENVVIFLSEDFQNKVVTLNETGALLFDILKNDTDKEGLINALLDEYDIDYDTASKDVEGFIETLKSIGALE